MVWVGGWFCFGWWLVVGGWWLVVGFCLGWWLVVWWWWDEGLVAPFPALGLSPTSLRLPSASSSFLPLLPFLSSFSPPSSLLLPSGVRITHQPHGPALTSGLGTHTPHTAEFVTARAPAAGGGKKGASPGPAAGENGVRGAPAFREYSRRLAYCIEPGRFPGQ